MSALRAAFYVETVRDVRSGSFQRGFPPQLFSIVPSQSVAQRTLELTTIHFVREIRWTNDSTGWPKTGALCFVCLITSSNIHRFSVIAVSPMQPSRTLVCFVALPLFPFCMLCQNWSYSLVAKKISICISPKHIGMLFTVPQC